MMEPAQKEHLLKIYRESLAEHGDTPEGVHWRGVTQRYRFKVLTEIANLETASILDYGCGKGDLFPYLVEQGFRGQYTGFDINPDLLALAHSKYPEVRFEVKDFEEDKVEEQFDYILISGVFNNRLPDNWGMMTSVLRHAFRCARHGVAFNAISTYVNFEDPAMFYANPEEVFRFCVTELSRDVTLRHDNLPYNYAVYVYRKPEWQP
jgi:SAM-dependent methyltransferase